MELVAGENDLPQSVGPRQSLLLLLRARIAPHVCPGHFLRPPRGSHVVLPPPGLSPPRRVLEHVGDEGPELGLGHLVHGGRNAVKDERGELVECLSAPVPPGGPALVAGIGRDRRLLGERRFHVSDNVLPVVAHHCCQGSGAKHLEGRVLLGVTLPWPVSHHHGLQPDARRKLLYQVLELAQELGAVALADGRVRLEGVAPLALPACHDGGRRGNADGSRGDEACGDVVLLEHGHVEELAAVKVALRAGGFVPTVVQHAVHGRAHGAHHLRVHVQVSVVHPRQGPPHVQGRGASRALPADGGRGGGGGLLGGRRLDHLRDDALGLLE